MRWTALTLLGLAFLTGLAACTNPDPPVETADTTEVALEDTAIVPVLAVARLESEAENRLEVELTYPQLNPSAAPELSTILDAVNTDITNRISTVVDTFLVWARESAASADTVPDGAVSSLEGSFSTPFVNERIFSVHQSVFTSVLGAAHPNSTSLVFNYDLGTGDQLELADLFSASTAYLDTLSAHTRTSLEFQGQALGMDISDFFEEGFSPAPANFERFTLGSDSLTLHFPPYAVAPYAAGPFTVSLAYSDLRPILMDAGPAATLFTR